MSARPILLKQNKLYQLPISLFVKSKCIPSDPVTQLGYDLNKPLIYVIPFEFQSDLYALKRHCLANNLPDPFEPLTINDITIPRCFFSSKCKDISLSGKSKGLSYLCLDLFYQLTEMHKVDKYLDVQIAPVSIVWDRTPGTELHPAQGLRQVNKFEQIKNIIVYGRDCIVRFGEALSLRKIADDYPNDEKITFKLVRVANIHFYREYRAAHGPNLPDRQAMFGRLIKSKAIKQAIENEAIHRKLSKKRVRQEAMGILEEIAAKFSPRLLRSAESIVGWVWSHLYKGINISNSEQVRKLAHSGNEIVYVPCHRSHMDYLLLTYVLYTEGLVPPHVAAGINLNFFPAGPIFRRGGAFFIRRSFRGNMLYSTIFREYLSELFSKGYSMEYFPEGGRSRTGRLRQPKTGMLAMIVQAMMRNTVMQNQRTLTMVPVYIGYEHIMEVSTYTKELNGMNKKEESFGQVLGIVKKLQNFGEGYVNFGTPINVNQYINNRKPNWQREVDPYHNQYPEWFPPLINDLAKQIMIGINDASAANALTLCATALLASNQHALSREFLEEQINVYLEILRDVRYSSPCTIAKGDAKKMVDDVMGLNKFIVETDQFGEMIMLDNHQTVLMTYYRNNIIHMLAIPSLVAHIFVFERQVSIDDIMEKVFLLYPFLQSELFMNFNMNSLAPYIFALLEQFEKMELIQGEGELLYRNPARLRSLQLLGNTITETLQRYALTLTLYSNEPDASKGELDQQSQTMAQRLSRLHNINAPEFSDKETFTTMITTLLKEGYLDENQIPIPEKIEKLKNCVFDLISHDIQLTIEAIFHPSTK